MGFFDIFKPKKSEENQKKSEPILEAPKEDLRKFNEVSDEAREKAALALTAKSVENLKLKELRERLTELEKTYQERALERKIKKLENDLYDEDEEDHDEYDEDEEYEEDPLDLNNLIKIFAANYFQSKIKNNPVSAEAKGHEQVEGVTSPSNLINLTDAEIEEVLNNYPDLASQAKGKPDILIKQFIKQNSPISLTDDTINRIVLALKKKEVKQIAKK